MDNRKVAFASTVVGLDCNALKLFCTLLDIPGPPDSYDLVHQNKIHEILRKKIEEHFEKNRELSRQTHGKDKNGNTVMPVSADGTYQKRGDCRRGYTSKVGIILLCDSVTNKYIDYLIMNKYCHRCVQMKKQLPEEAFDAWQQQHDEKGECSANFDGPSSEMERIAVKDLFQSSLQHKLIYKWLVGDGDSKCFLDVWDCYGVCDLCLEHKDLLTKRSSPDYQSWNETDSFHVWQNAHNSDSQCKAVIKIDCIQHIGKNFRKKLEDLAVVGAKAPDGKSMTRGKHRLRPEARVRLQKYFNKNVRENSRPGVINQDEMADAAKK